MHVFGGIIHFYILLEHLLHRWRYCQRAAILITADRKLQNNVLTVYFDF